MRPSNPAAEPLTFYIRTPQSPCEPLAACDCGACVEPMGGQMPTGWNVGSPASLLADSASPLVLSEHLNMIPVKNHIAVFHQQQGHFLVVNDLGGKLLQQCSRPVHLKDIILPDRFVPLEKAEAFFATLSAMRMIRPVHREEPQAEITPYADTLIAWLHLTNQCNLQCHYCYITQSGQQMSASTARHTLRKLFEMAVSHGYKRI